MGLCPQTFTPGCSSIRPHHLPSLADGLFGQCQVGSVQDRPYFQVTSPVLQRLQDVLRHLMAQGEWGTVQGLTAVWWGGGVRQHCLVALGLSGVLLAQGPGWAERGPADSGRIRAKRGS